MKIFKFGGSVLKTIKDIEKLSHRIISEKPSLIVISALDKSTNELEKIYTQIIKAEACSILIDSFLEYYSKLITNVYQNAKKELELKNKYKHLLIFASKEYLKTQNEDKLYSEIVCIGELLTSEIIYEFLSKKSKNLICFDSRTILKTKNHYLNAELDWVETEKNIKQIILPQLQNDKILITQGFIASSIEENLTTTLGREGSDYTAAIFAKCLNANSMVLYKNVPGIMTANPQYFHSVKKLDVVSYEFLNTITTLGSKIVHKKTIEPLQNTDIELIIRDFNSDTINQTVIKKNMPKVTLPILVDKKCIFVSINLHDTTQYKLTQRLAEFLKNYNAILLMQNNGEKFKICIEISQNENDKMIADLQKNFKIHEVIHDASMISILYTDNFKPYFSTKTKILIWQYDKGICQIVLKTGDLEEWAKHISL